VLHDRVISGVLVLVLATGALAAEAPSQAKTAVEAETDTVLVTATAATVGEDIRIIEPGADLQRSLERSPFFLIRRGASGSSDLYADGFRKSDITVTIDGERFTTACPNRMDTRAGQVNLLDVERIALDRTGGALQAGLGGQVAFRRRPPGEDFQIRGRMMAAFDHSDEQDFAVTAEGHRIRGSLRYRRQGAWEDADGGTFEDSYGFAETPAAEIFEAQAMTAWEDGNAVATLESSRDVLFPYLKMDERENDHYQASMSHRGHRLYFNHNEHMMDAALRTSLAMTDMRTDATNTMFGAVGGFYEVYARNWQADNVIIPAANPAMAIENRMLPDVWRLYASGRWARGDTSAVNLALRLGLSHTKIHDESQADRYALLYPDAETGRLAVPFGATVSHSFDLRQGWRLGWSAEAASDDPAIEALYISVDKPGPAPTWLGNPDLKNPVRATLRAELRHERLRCEVFGTRVWEYSYMVRRMVGIQSYQTYEGIDALLAGTNLTLDWRHVGLGATWNWGEKTGDKSPLAEIQPLVFTVAARSPAFGPATARLLYQHAAGQGRVDTIQNETTTGAWDRVDLGVEVAAGAWTLSADLENAFNELYAQHLSYLRNPFSSGVKVLEPGRTVRVVAAFMY